MRFKLFYGLGLFLGFCNSLQAQTENYNAVVAKEIASNFIENTKNAQAKPYVIMVSLDGFRHDYAEKYKAANLLDMAKNGARAKRLLPSFPSKTFPNHYTLATGLYPSKHGIVANSFFDTKIKKRYSIGNRNAVEDGGWYGGVPLWNLAQLQGMVAASYFWVGSEANINGLHPKYYYKYDKKTPYEFRVKRVMEWLQLPEKDRPHMITLYFSLVDTQGHKFGPESDEVSKAVAFVDKQIGALRKGIQQSGLPVYLIVTSDHGMTPVSKFINIHDFVSVDNENFLGGPVGMIYTDSEDQKNSLLNVLTKQSHFASYTKESVPDYLNFKNNPRIGDIVLIAKPPYTLINSAAKKEDLTKAEGTHGYDPYRYTDMGGIFYVEGPSIAKGTSVAEVENINVYPFVAHLLGLDILTPIDGNLEKLLPLLQSAD